MSFILCLKFLYSIIANVEYVFYTLLLKVSLNKKGFSSILIITIMMIMMMIMALIEEAQGTNDRQKRNN